MSLETRKTGKLEDPGARLLDAIAGYGQRYGRIAGIVAAVIAVVGAGAFFTLRARAASEEQAAGRLAEANILFWQGDYPRSLQLAKQVAEQWPRTPSGTDAHRLAGDDEFWNGQFKNAVKEYRTYLEQQKQGLVADAVRRSLAYALESDRQLQEAATLDESLVGRFDRESSAELLYAAARCYRLMNQVPAASQRLQRLLDEFGETSYANRARMELAELSSSAR
ncbi:MAG: tetratricopeptide repeat protein [Candidatus Eisenbacteria bacterium]|nr:tetratricopeptide repeat protein [Candidatus Eisenbacteria bacterium]